MRVCPIDGCTMPGIHGHGTDAKWLSRLDFPVPAPQAPPKPEKPADRRTEPPAPPCDPRCGGDGHVYLCPNELREAGMDNRQPRWKKAVWPL